MIAVKTPTSLGSIARSLATAGIITPSDSTDIEIITWMASMLATGTKAPRRPERRRPKGAEVEGPLFTAKGPRDGEKIPPLRFAPVGMTAAPSHPEQVSLVQDGVAQDTDRGDVDHDAVDVDRAQALGLGLGVGLLELAGARHVLGLGRVDLQRMLDLGRMDRPLADAAQDHRAAAFLAIGFRVLEVGKRAVDGVDAGGAAGHHQPEAGIVPDVARVTARFTDVLVGDAHRGREVAHAEHQ